LIPRWLTVVAVGRDVMIGAGALIYRLGWGPLHGRPMLSSKLNTLLQLLYLLAVVSHAGFQLPNAGVLVALAWLTCSTLLLSGFLYAREFTSRALQFARA
jgi:cardiolipin synthase